MTDRITAGLQWLTGEISADRDEFRRAHHPGGDMLLDGLVSQGFVRERGGRFAVNPAGNRRMNDGTRDD